MYVYPAASKPESSGTKSHNHSDFCCHFIQMLCLHSVMIIRQGHQTYTYSSSETGKSHCLVFPELSWTSHNGLCTVVFKLQYCYIIHSVTVQLKCMIVRMRIGILGESIYKRAVDPYLHRCAYNCGIKMKLCCKSMCVLSLAAASCVVVFCCFRWSRGFGQLLYCEHAVIETSG